MSSGGSVEVSTDRPSLDVERIRADFPVLARQVHGHPLVYLDNAASAQKPRTVLDAVDRFYSRINSNVHRGIHELSQEATAAYEAARATVQRFLNAASVDEIVFCRGTTEAINLVASTFGRQRVRTGDEILVTTMEHHSNIVPWQQLCQATGAKLEVAPITDAGQVDLDQFSRLLTDRTRLVSFVHVSNTLGTVTPARELIDRAHARGIPVLVDGAQAVPHMPVDVRALDCDFYALSGHKAFGPLGIGVLYGRRKWLEEMAPYQGGGEMILSVRFDRTTYKEPPHKFEAGTPNVVGAVGLAAALDYVRGIGFGAILMQEMELLARTRRALQEIGGVRIFGDAACKAAVVSFAADWAHPHDIGTFLDQEGIAIRTGHHCTQPLMERLGVPATARASFAFYNTAAEVDALAAALRRAKKFFA
ncbi:MAG: cysteine desulfurase [Planctomycetota bacterium]